MKRNTLTTARRLAQRGCFALRPLSAAALLLVSVGAQAETPVGTGTYDTLLGVVNSSRPNANTQVLDVATPKAYIQTPTFSVPATGRVDINMLDAKSVLGVQVTGFDPSLIFGAINSNGRVFLMNPNGIVFGATARVDVGSLVATTMSLSLGDFKNNQFRLTDNGDGQGALAGVVRNDGTIIARNGDVVLAGRQVINTGQILAENGRVGLVAASKLLVDVEGDGLLFFEVEGNEAGARLAQLGRIEANGGSVELRAAARSQFADTVLNMSGVVQAKSLGTKQGRVVIDGGSTGVTSVTGQIDVSGLEPGQRGGSVSILGDKVALLGQAQVNASGAAGGGQVLVGGNYQGQGSERRASQTLVGKDVRINADATDQGDGGQVVVWADGSTHFQGKISARGGANGGNGGQVEVSGKAFLDYLGSVDLRAGVGGLKGLLLLDPKNIEIVAAGPDLNGDAGGLDLTTASFGATAGADASLSKITDNALEAQLNLADVHLTASKTITVSSAIAAGGSTANSGLWLTAGEQIALKADVSTKNGIKLDGGLTGGITVSGAAVTLNAGAGKLSLGEAVNGGAQNLTLISTNTAADAISTSGAITNTAALSVQGKSTLNGNVTTTGDQTYTGTTTLGANVQLDAGAAKISLAAVDGGTPKRNLTLVSTNAAANAISTSGTITNTAVLSVQGKSTLGADVTTTGNQTYTGATTLGANVQMDAGANKISLTSVDGGTHNLTLKSTSGAGDAIGTSGAIANTAVLSVQGNSSLGGNVTSTGGQTYTATTTMAAPVQLTGSSLTFNNIASGANSIGLRADAVTVAGNVTVGGPASVTFEPLANNGSVSVANGLPVAAGTLQLSQALLNKFSGYQSIVVGSLTNPYTIAFGNFTLPTKILAFSSIGGISFRTLDGAFALDTQTTGTISLNDVVGGTTALTALTTLSLNGPVHINTTGVTTTGNQTYNGAVTLGANTTLDAKTAKISLAGAVDGGTPNHNLTLKSANADADAVSTTGVITNVGALSVQAKSTLGANITTSGDQTYTDATVLSADVQLNAGGNKIALTSVDGDTHNLTLVSTNAAANAIATSGAISNTAALSVQGKSTLGGNVTTTGNQTYTGTTTLGANAQLDAGASKISLAAVDGGTHNLTLKSSNVAADAIATGGAISNTAALSVQGKSTLGGDVTTTGTQTYTNTVTLGANTAFTTTNLSVTGDLEAGARNLSVFADAMSVSGAINSSGGTATIAGRQVSTTIGVAGGAGDFQVTSSLLNKFSSFGTVTVGRTNGTGAITVGNLTGGSALNRNLTVRNGSADITFGQVEANVANAHTLDAATATGTVRLNGNIGATNKLNSLVVDGATSIGASSIATAGTQHYKGAVTLTNNVDVNGSTVTYDRTVSGAHTLTVNALSGGSAIFKDAINIGALAVHGLASVAADVTTTGTQTYVGAVTLQGDVDFTGPTLDFQSNLIAGARDLGLLANDRTITGTVSGTGAAQIAAYATNKNIVVDAAGVAGDMLVDQTTLGKFSTFSSLIIGRADGTGSITVGTNGGGFNLPANLTLLSNSGAIDVLSAVTGNAHSLTLNTGGTTTISGGATGLSTLATNAGGATHLGGTITTSGTQTYGDAVVLDGTADLTGGTVQFASTVDGSTVAGQSLNIVGNAIFGGAVGGTTSLNNLYLITGTGQFNNGGAHTNGYQYFAGDVTLGNDATFKSDGSFVIFNGKLNGAHTATTNAGTYTDFRGVVGDTAELASINVQAGATRLRGNVSTIGTQTYTGPTSLLANTTLNGTNIALNGAVDGAQTLTVNASGTTTLGGAVGGTTALTSLSTQAATSINGGLVRTDGAQSYGGAVTLGADTTVNANTVDFNGAVNGARALTVNDSGVTTFHGDVGTTTKLTSLTTTLGGSTVLPSSVATTGAQTYGDPVTLAANTALSANSVSLANLTGANHALSIAATGLTDFNGTVTGLSSLSKTGTGATRIHVANGLTTTGAQSYGGDVDIVHGGSATFDASALTFSGDISGANGLTLTGDSIGVTGAVTGTGTFTLTPKSVGTTIGLSGGTGALQVDLSNVSGFSQRIIGRADGTGAINVGASSLSADTTVQSGSGNITFAALDGAHDLTVNTGGVTTFNGNVGATTALTSLTTDAGGSTQFNASSASATTALNFGDAVGYTGSVSFTAPSLSFGGGASGGTNLTLSTNSLSLGADLSGTGVLTLQPTGAGTDIGLLGGAGALQITQAMLNRVTGFSAQTIGRTDGTGAVDVGAALSLARDTTVRSASGNVTFGSTVDGAHVLAVNTGGTTTFNGDVGGTTALTSLSTDAGGGSHVNASQVKATTSLAFGDAVTYTGSATFTGATQSYAQGITGGTNLTLVADSLSYGVSVSGSGILNIQPLTATSIGLAGAAGILQITQSMFDQTTGFTQQVIGRSTGVAVDILSNALVLTGDTTVQSNNNGQIHFQSTVDGAHALTVNTAGVSTFSGAVGSTTALTSVTTDAPGSTTLAAGSIRTTGAQTYNDPVTANGTLSLVASAVTLHATNNLTLGLVNLSAGGDISTDGVLTLSDSLNLTGGTLTLSAAQDAGGGIGFTDPELSARLSLILGARFVREAAAAITQTGGTITTATGTTLDLKATGRGSILVDHTTNNIAGEIKVVSGPEGDTATGRFASTGAPLPLSFVRIDSQQINAAGIEADAVKLTANTLNTTSGTKIRARLPFINAQGTDSAVPALTLVLKQPTVINQFGTAASSSWIQVDLGDSRGGFLTVRPKGAGAGASAVYLGGSDANIPFYDGTSKASEIQVYFNGRVPSTPQEVGALSAVTAVIEESRRSRFDEAVRTENVSSRLRTGVIAEVGAGRPATEGTESILMPASCTPSATLACQ